MLKIALKETLDVEHAPRDRIKLFACISLGAGPQALQSKPLLPNDIRNVTLVALEHWS